VLAVLGLSTAYFQYRKAANEAKSFRQQLLPVLHHVEGISTALQTIGGGNEYSSVNDMKNAINALHWDAQALFFGLVETKVGGVPLSKDIDIKYKEWVSLELDRKTLVLKDWLEQRKASPSTKTRSPTE
jgi:hypothetical protein